VRSIVQKAVVRVISSELDRRSASLEQALRDAHVRLDAATATTAATSNAVQGIQRALETSVQNIGTAQDRMVSRLDELTERVRKGEDVDRSHLADLEQLRFDVAAAQSGLADVTGVIERLTQAG
jgi:chromosome segregation ATPase